MSGRPTAVDVMGFAGGFACGVQLAGFDVIAKKEPSKFKGFGVGAFEYNMPHVEVEVNEAEYWSIIQSDMVFGCPRCSGFSQMSAANKSDTKTGVTGKDGKKVNQRAIDSPINEDMFEFWRYVGAAKPQIAIMESVPQAGRMGFPLMRELWELARERSGIDYQATMVFMQNATIGSDVLRPRFFMVLHQVPFGVEMPTLSPRPMRDVIGDLPEEEDTEDLAWGHMTSNGQDVRRIKATIRLFREHGYDWAQGKRLPEHMKHWYEVLEQEIPDFWYNSKGDMLSHAYSDNMYSPFRYRWDEPMGVVTGGFLERGVHPLYPRTFTYREGARFMGLPDDWNLTPYIVGKNGNWLGKAVTVGAGKWIATWASAALAGTPGGYVGEEVEPGFRSIDVSNEKKVKEIVNKSPDWMITHAPPPEYSFEPDRRGRPRAWDVPWVARHFDVTVMAAPTVTHRPVPTAPIIEVAESPVDVCELDPQKIEEVKASMPAARTRAMWGQGGRGPGRPLKVVERVPNTEVVALLEELDMTKSDAAAAFGVSVSRIAELTGTRRPESWLDRARWAEFEGALRSAARLRLAPAEA